MREILTAVTKVTFDHGANHTRIGQALVDDFLEDLRLLGRILATVGVVAVCHDRGNKAGGL